MKIVEVYVDNELLDMYSGTNIKFTRQVNDIAEVKDRQASYTNSFSVPMTPNNVRIFKGLGLPSDTSRIPYQKPACRMKLEGFDLIVKGWLNVTETTDEYKIYVYSGIINFFKAIENLTIGKDLDLSEINHEKTVDNVIGSYVNPNYKYLIADYNGKTHYGTNRDIINIDYIQPSVKVSYLWEKIHKGTEKLYRDEKYPVGGFQIAGEIFNSEKFQNLFITYPKPTDDKSIEFIPILDTIGRGGLYRWSSGNPTDNNTYCHILSFDGIGEHYTFTKPGKRRYRITISFNLKSENISSVPSPFAPFEVYLSKNQENERLIDRIPTSRQLFYIADGLQEREIPPFIFQEDYSEGDVLTFFFYFRLNGITINYDYTLKIEEVDNEDIDFSNELKDFSITDFVKEVLNHFGLTMLTEEHSNVITYRTLNERINKSKIIDWSEKYIERESEEYIANTYAQRNFFEYQYNDREGTYNNGFILVDNKNLQDQKTVYKSKTYSPEQEFTKFFLNANRSENVNIFKFYDKEVNEDPAKPIKYKPLQKRYYFIRGEQLLNESIKIGSELQNKETTTTGIYLGNFSRLDFESILMDNYKDFEKILNDSRIHNISLNLNEIDILLLDFDRLYYFAQQQQYYLLNRLQFDSNNAKGEFIRVKFSGSTTIPEDNEVTIQWIDEGISSTTSHTGYDIVSTVKGIPKELVWQRRDKGGQWIDVEPVTSTQKRFEFVLGQNQFRVKYINGVISAISNVLTYERTLEVDPNKCYEFDLKSPVPKTVTVVYKNFDNIEITKELIFYTAGQVITISGKQMINTGGIDDIIQRTVPCPTFECHRYYISTVGGSGDDLTVTWTDCNGVEHTDTQYSNAPGTTLSLTICAREGQFSHNSRNDAIDEGLCS